MSAPDSFWTNGSQRLHLSGWEGEGQPLLLVHGMGAHTGWFDRTGELLAGSTRPAALDLSGHGDSDWRADGLYSTEAWVADIESARHALGWERFVLVGHSLGARISLEYAAAHPARLSALVVVDFLPAFEGGRFSRPRSVPQPYYDSEQAILSRFRLQPDGTVLPEERLRALALRSIRKGERGWTWKYDWRAFRYAYLPIWDVLPRVKTRTLVVRGEHSRIMDEAALRRVEKALPDGYADTAKGAHHHVPLDAPDYLYGLIAGFLG